ncbi:branched-chain amino acid aminotransferase [Streptomyces sp. NBC_01142]|uniref:branched-chain amino acid aminotransferase n=1 Tax=Streptomyces sp. NBC_01142 TaxID=2975865 RepID=UPI002255067F|nr:branched-chain amino acid aminotransferase [Streptomyces sp. NBC_01142]MCX4820186.1 branched-chain amino acid aminotransferase [Streptomyces sp. NBC_01142]
MENTNPTIFETRPVRYRVPADVRTERMADPLFGTVFTEHMAGVRYVEGKGWHDARIQPFGPIPMSPATAALHYGQEIFEGLKAYRTPDGSAQLFRPEANARRFQNSAARLSMPELPEDIFLTALRELVAVDREWLPSAPGTSLYLRPFQIATEEYLGVRPAVEYLFGVIACPVGASFPGGEAPLTIWVSDTYTRAATGGTGAAKCAGNYAASMAAHRQARDAGCEQVVFLDAVERRYVEELGGMNLFFVFDDGTLLTPPLGGTILPGITRDSVMTLAGDAGHRVVERPYSLAEWRADAADGRLREVFACGTAAVITPVGTVRSAEGEFTISGGTAGPVTEKLRSTLTDIQYGRTADPYGWTRRLD